MFLLSGQLGWFVFTAELFRVYTVLNTREDYHPMKHHSKTFRRVRIFVLWLVCMIVFNFALFNVIRTQKYDRAREDLAVQAKIVSGHLPSIIENDTNSRAGRNLFTDKMNTLAFVLEKTDDPEKVRTFTAGFAEVAGLAGITVNDREGNAVYSTPDAGAPEDPETMRLSLKSLAEAEKLGNGYTAASHNTDYKDIDSFIEIRTQHSGGRYALHVRFTWLNAFADGSVHGVQQSAKVPLYLIRHILRTGETVKFLYQEPCAQAKIDSSRAGETIRRIICDKHKRRAFCKAMRSCFQCADETVNLYNDYGDSFYFTTESGFPADGGLVLFENTYDGHKGLCYQVCT